jgi:hypothetical protein
MPKGLLIYKNDCQLKNGDNLSYEFLSGTIIEENVEISNTIWALYNERKTPISSLYAIATVINKQIPGNEIDWAATFKYVCLKKLWQDQASIYDSNNLITMVSDWSEQDRYYEIESTISFGKSL